MSQGVPSRSGSHLPAPRAQSVRPTRVAGEPRPLPSYEARVAEEGKSGKRVVAIMLALVLGVSLLAWLAATRIERNEMAMREAAGEGQSAAVVSDGVMYEAKAGDPGFVIAKDIGSGKELWRAELGSLSTEPALVVGDELIEVEIAGTPWMTLDRESGEPVE